MIAVNDIKVLVDVRDVVLDVVELGPEVAGSQRERLDHRCFRIAHPRRVCQTIADEREARAPPERIQHFPVQIGARITRDAYVRQVVGLKSLPRPGTTRSLG